MQVLLVGLVCLKGVFWLWAAKKQQVAFDKRSDYLLRTLFLRPTSEDGFA